MEKFYHQTGRGEGRNDITFDMTEVNHPKWIDIYEATQNWLPIKCSIYSMLTVSNFITFLTSQHIQHYLQFVYIQTNQYFKLWWRIQLAYKQSRPHTWRVEKTWLLAFIAQPLLTRWRSVDKCFYLIHICIIHYILHKTSRFLETINWCCPFILVAHNSQNSSIRCKDKHC